MAEKDEGKILTQDQVAEILGVATDTLEAWRYKKRYGLSYLKIGSLVRYRAEDVQSFIERRLVTADSSARSSRRRRSRVAA